MKLYYDAHGKRLVTEREIVHLDESDYIVLERYRAQLDEYRLPLETLEHSQQMKECAQWVERIVTAPEVAESVLPQGRDADVKTETYTLLLLVLQFRSRYEERDVAKYFAIFTALSFLGLMQRRKEMRKRMAKVVRWILVAAVCSLAWAVWMRYF
ncbi:hypothetical protein AVEN_220795-1 [Araneus ventricosus]|uniref:Uncharacterized protein n=1 Tax=Araneus ventricosus TaxID=182803 RepID=A0A4Y2JZE3_ARAVE|nr:hypothetical protein AVEN_220795-1 [Araneus ventricosus]